MVPSIHTNLLATNFVLGADPGAENVAVNDKIPSLQVDIGITKVFQALKI